MRPNISIYAILATNLRHVLSGLKNEMKAYEIDKITSRKIVEHLIEEFVGIPKA
jgi:hypothetical protein